MQIFLRFVRRELAKRIAPDLWQELKEAQENYIACERELSRYRPLVSFPITDQMIFHRINKSWHLRIGVLCDADKQP